MEVFMFPGQGSQKRGMGADLMTNTDFEVLESEISDFLGYSIRQLCLEDPDGVLNETQYTQPALYVVNYLACQKALTGGNTPHYMVGHSLGEINALQAAGAFSFSDGLKIVQKRGDLMSQSLNGSMAAVVGAGPEDVLEILSSEKAQDVDIANLNSPSQTVISGPTDAISELKAPINEKEDLTFFQLPVSAAFHSRYMKKAAETFSKFLEDFNFEELRVPVVSNVTARPYPSGNISEVIRISLSEQMVRPVRWSDTLNYLAEVGVTVFSEIGPGNVLSRLKAQVLATETENAA